MANKSLGQHWLYNREILDWIAGAASGGEGGVALEIGPGLGTLTAALFRQFEKVVAVEFDKELARKLPGSFPGKNLEVVNADFLQFDLSSLPEGYAAAGNIPYYITSPIIEKLLTAENAPKRAVLLMQKEVAERITSERETVLSIKCKNRANVWLGPVVPREEFTPPPEVDSQVVVFEPHPPILSDKVMKFAMAGFSQPRKKLVHNLAGYRSQEELREIFMKNNIDTNIRAGEVHLEDWQRIYELVVEDKG